MQRPGVVARCTLVAFSVGALGLRGVLGVKPYVRLIGALWILCALASCGEAPSPTAAIDSQIAQFAQVTGGPACAPTDQDQYVYDPRRLQVVQACIRVSGIVDALEMETDGDTVIHLHLDPQFQNLLRPANLTDERGDLVVELICMSQPVQPNAMVLCDGDPDPYAGPIPSSGAHVWMEGRYVLDLHHGGHSELHPLYRAGLFSS
jgi:hypothetical protein